MTDKEIFTRAREINPEEYERITKAYQSGKLGGYTEYMSLMMLIVDNENKKVKE